MSECNNRCQFSIGIFDNNSIPLINMNQQVIINLKQNFPERYYFLNNINQSFTIFFTSIKGKYKIYISKSKKVSSTDYLWNSTEDRQIIVDSNEKNKLKGTFYIYLEPLEDCIFSLLIYNEKRVIQLKEGMPFHYIFGGTNLNTTSLFYDLRHDKINIEEPVTIGIHIKSISRSFIPDIYIKSTNNFNDFPNMTSYHQKIGLYELLNREYNSYIKSNNTFVTITIIPIFLSGAKAKQGELEFSIFSDQSIILREKNSIEVTIAKELDYKIFNIYSNYADNATITITSCSGNIEYEILKQYTSSNYTKVNKDRQVTTQFVNQEFINEFEGKYAVNIVAKRLGSIINNGSQEKKAIFSIEYKLNQPSLSHPPPLKQIRFVDSNGIIFIEWDDAITKDLIKEDTFINYTIYATEMKDALFETICGIKYSNPLVLGIVYNLTEFNFQSPYKEDFILNIIANINYQEEILYKSVLITQNSTKSGIMIFLSVLYFYGVFCLFVLTCALYSRLNKNQNSSEYELRELNYENHEDFVQNSSPKELIRNSQNES